VNKRHQYLAKVM